MTGRIIRYMAIETAVSVVVNAIGTCIAYLAFRNRVPILISGAAFCARMRFRRHLRSP